MYYNQEIKTLHQRLLIRTNKKITPIFKKDDILNKDNYRPVSILPHSSKVFERILYKQVDSFMQNKFSPYLCEIRKNHNAQYSLLKMIEN